MMINSDVTQLLISKGIAFDVITIPLSEDHKPVRQLEALLEEQGLAPGSVVRSIVFKGGSGHYYMLAVAGGGRADWDVLRQFLDERQLRMAEYDEVQEATGYVVGAVPPIALPDSLRVLVDKSVRKYDKVVIGSVLGFALAIDCTDLLGLLTHADESGFVKV
jgi:Cys-tRNA(Pro)/Cys-tRNA(Cys) deacylase